MRRFCSRWVREGDEVRAHLVNDELREIAGELTLSLVSFDRRCHR